MSARAWALLSAIAGIWGSSFLFIRVLLDHGVGPEGVAFGRTALGALSLLPLAALRASELPRSARTWAKLALLAGLNFAIPWSLIAYAQQHVTSGMAAIGNASMPLWTALLSALVFRLEHLNGLRLLGLAFGFGGVVLLMSDDLSGLGGNPIRGVPIILLATLLYALSAVAIRRWYGDVSPFGLTFAQVALAAVYLFPLALGTGGLDGVDWDASTLASLAFLGALGSGVAVFGYMSLLREVGPVRASVVTYLIPPTGVVLGWAVLDEPLGMHIFVALAGIALGVALVQGAVEQLLRRNSRAVTSPPAEPLC